MDRTLFYTWKWWYLQLCHFIFFENIVYEIASFHSSKFLRFLLWLVVGSGADLCHPSWESKKMENPSRLLVELTHTWSWTPNDSTFKSNTHTRTLSRNPAFNIFVVAVAVVGVVSINNIKILEDVLFLVKSIYLQTNAVSETGEYLNCWRIIEQINS